MKYLYSILMRNKSSFSLYVDAFFCLVMIPGMFCLMPIERWMERYLPSVIFLFVYLYVVYFTNRKWCIPFFFNKKNRKWAVVISVLMLLTTYFITENLFPLQHHDIVTNDVIVKNIGRGIKTRVQSIWFLFFIVTGVSYAIGLLVELNKQMVIRQSIEFEKNKAELALYKAQINPHFLFNSLNTLYGLIVEKSDKAESAFLKFTDILNYMYSNTITDYIPLNKEIDYIRQYIELQELRLNDMTKVNIICDINSTSLLIPPFLLITFVENAFKYGVSSSKLSSITFSFVEKDGILAFSSQNKILKKNSVNLKKGIGIENCKKRLDLLYNNNYSLVIDSDESDYKVNLKIDLLKRNNEKG